MLISLGSFPCISRTSRPRSSAAFNRASCFSTQENKKKTCHLSTYTWFKTYWRHPSVVLLIFLHHISRDFQAEQRWWSLCVCTENCSEALSADWPCKEGHPGTGGSARQCPPETQATETYGPAPWPSSTNARLKNTEKPAMLRSTNTISGQWELCLVYDLDWTHPMCFFTRKMPFTTRNVKSILQKKSFHYISDII